MPEKIAQSGKIEAERSQLSIQVEHYDARIQFAINQKIYTPEYDWLSDERDPVHAFESRVDITGAMLGLTDRTEDTYKLTIYGDDSPSRRLDSPKINTGIIAHRWLENTENRATYRTLAVSRGYLPSERL